MVWYNTCHIYVWQVLCNILEQVEMSTTMALPSSIANAVAFHLPHIPEQNKTYTTLVSSTVLIYHKGQHCPQTWRSYVEDMVKACL